MVAACGENATEPEPTTGSLQVTTSTSGENPDPDGYTVVIDGTQSQSIGVSGTVTFSEVAAEQHQVELQGVAENCTVSNNPRTVTVTAGGTASAAFDVTCAATIGDLAVSASTAGDDMDPDGYTVTVDPGTAEELSKSIGLNETVTFSNLDEGDHQVELSGVADNCTVSNNPRTTTVPAGGSVQTDFAVVCARRVGNLEVSTSTTGEDFDPDGYTVTVDPGTPDELSKSIGLNETVTFSNLDEGDHEVELSGLAVNCTVSNNPRTAAVTHGATATTTFDVSCVNASIVFEALPDGGNWDIYVMNADGSGQTNLTNDPASDRLPAWSPDKSKIAFTSDRAGENDIWVMNANGTGPVNLTSDLGGNIFIPDFSPDGTKIAFTRVSGGVGDIWVMNADGSNKTQITATASDERHPRWSPDGTKIAFRSDRDGDTEIYVMDADGSNQENLTNSSSTDDGLPTWSPDGTQIAFARHFFGPGGETVDTDIIVMDAADGANQTNLIANGADTDGAASWSPDGSKIAFFSDRDGNLEIYIMNADGTNQTRITSVIDRADRAPAWDAPGTP